MTKYRNSDGSVDLAMGVPFELGGIKYPRNWLELATADEIAAIGLTAYEPDPMTDAERAALIALDRTDFLFALAQAVSQPFSTIVSYVSGVIDASDMSASDKDLAKGLLTYAVKFHRVDPDIGADLLNAVGAELSLTPAQIDTLFLTAAGQS